MKQEMMTVVAQRPLAPKIFELTLSGQLVKEMQLPGQFLNILVPQKDLILRRPISINQIDQQNLTCRIIYRVEGAGTKALAQLTTGAKVDVLGPLGNGYSLANLQAGDQVYLVGGGIGIPPLYELAKQLQAIGVQPIHFLGFASKEVVYYEKEFAALGPTFITTDDGSYQHQGHVGTILPDRTQDVQIAGIFACGNNGLLKMVTQRFSEHPNAQISLEARMACGVGACYACVCHADEPSQTKSYKVCDEGPIFHVGQVVL
ncbi:MAG: dihydroorotate dehydrogenase electron transfer subunit [Enterococcus sp.]